MRAVIFLNGKIEDQSFVAQMLRRDDYLIGADGGTLHCLAMGRQPQAVVGDFDSLESTILDPLVANGTLIERHPRAKNQTDLELAIEWAINVGAEEILLVGATGGRLDQSLANLLILAQRQWPVVLKVIDGNQIAQVLRCGQHLQFYGQIGATLSILPLTQRVTGITYTGMAFPLENASLRLGSTRGISNEIIASPASLEIKSGILLVVQEIGRQDDNNSILR